MPSSESLAEHWAVGREVDHLVLLQQPNPFGPENATAELCTQARLEEQRSEDKTGSGDWWRAVVA